MRIVKISSLLRKKGLKLPEFKLKEDLVRFLVESKSERIVEIPLVLGYIPHKKSKILDVGCRYSMLSIQLASLGHKVYGIDINNYFYEHPNFIFKKGNILKPNFPKESFDVVISLSTIEHIGLGVYGDKTFSDGDIKAVKSISDLLKKEGFFIITVPFGKAVVSKFQRVYNFRTLKKLLNGYRIKELKTFISINGYWQPAKIKDAEMVDSSEESNAIAFVVANKSK